MTKLKVYSILFSKGAREIVKTLLHNSFEYAPNTAYNISLIIVIKLNSPAAAVAAVGVVGEPCMFF